MKNLNVIYGLGLLILFSCNITEIDSVTDNVEFWENLRISSEADNIELVVSKENGKRIFKISFINSKFNSIEESTYSKFADSLLDHIYGNVEFDSTFLNYEIEFVNGVRANVRSYSLDEVYAVFGLKSIINKKYEEAFAFFDKAINVNSEKSQFYFNRAFCSFRMADFKKSLEDLKIYRKFKQESINYLILLARNYKELDERKNNEEVIQKLKKSYPEYKISEKDIFSIEK